MCAAPYGLPHGIEQGDVDAACRARIRRDLLQRAVELDHQRLVVEQLANLGLRRCGQGPDETIPVTDDDDTAWLVVQRWEVCTAVLHGTDLALFA